MKQNCNFHSDRIICNYAPFWSFGFHKVHIKNGLTRFRALYQYLLSVCPLFFILPNSNIMYLFFPCATQLWANGLSLTKLSIWWETIHYTMLACLEVLGGSNWPRRPCEETGEEPGQMVGKILSCGKQGIWLVPIKVSFKSKWYMDG